MLGSEEIQIKGMVPAFEGLSLEGVGKQIDK